MEKLPPPLMTTSDFQWNSIELLLCLEKACETWGMCNITEATQEKDELIASAVINFIGHLFRGPPHI